MIGRQGRLFIFLYVVFLAVLFLMCSTDLIIREPERESYQIAVIIDDVRGDNYSNFRKGMDQAAMEFNIDVHFITLYETTDTEQQMRLMDREQQDGADALIVVPVDEKQAAGKQIGVPVILLRSESAEGVGSGSIVIDYEKMGELLAREVLQDIPEQSRLLLLTDERKQSAIERLFLKGAESVFADDGRRVRIVRQDGENDLKEALEALELQEEEKVALLAGNQDILTEAAGLLVNEPDISRYVEGLYGRGNTMSILNYLDQGVITGICVTDDFSVGYLSVRAAVQALEGNDNPPVRMESYYIEKGDLREPACEKLLFPIE